MSSGCARWGDAPESFGETAVEVEARPTSYWEDLTRSVTEPGRVGGMWVDPAWRRRGVGRLLYKTPVRRAVSFLVDLGPSPATTW